MLARRMKNEMEKVDKWTSQRSGLMVKEDKSSKYYHEAEKLMKSYRTIALSIDRNMQMIQSKFQMLYDQDIDEFLDRVYACGMEFCDDNSGVQCLVESMRFKRNRLLMVKESVRTIAGTHPQGKEITTVLFYSYMSRNKYKTREKIEKTSTALEMPVSQTKFYQWQNEGLWLLGMLLWGEDREVRGKTG